MSHPTAEQLMDWFDGRLDSTDGSVVASHLRVCAECEELVRQFGDFGTIAEDELPNVLVPAAMQQAFSAQSAPDPTPSQLWYLEWNGEGALVLVLAVRGLEVVVAPVVIGGVDGDESAVRLHAAENPLGVDVVIWLGLETTVPLGVLFACSGSLDDHIYESLVRHTRAGGVAIGSAQDHRSLERAELASRLWRLSDAVPITAPGWSVRPLAEYLRRSAVAATDVADKLSLSPSDFTQVSRGTRRLSDSELVKLGQALDVAPEELISEPTSAYMNVAYVLQHPRRRRGLRDRAARVGQGEAQTRAAVAEQVLTMAARSSGSGQQDLDWEQLIDDVLTE